jgi:hypothetical protein
VEDIDFLDAFLYPDVFCDFNYEDFQILKAIKRVVLLD